MENILNQLNWNGAKKYWCATNVMNAFGVKNLGDAYMWFKHCDKFDNPEVGDIIVMKQKNKYFKATPVGTQDGYWYGHVAVITKVNGNILTITDGPTSFTFDIDKKFIDGYITPKKIIQLGSKIKIEEKKLGKYEEIFKNNFGESTIYKDLDGAKEIFGDIAYFIAIGLERIKKDSN